ncbi:MAG: tRNA(Met) cytidine acetate ligase [Anaerococcus sp.]
MKTLAIISEFNPFHNGHKYLLEKSKEITGADFALTIMSGDFVQRGEPAIIDKFRRADVALECGFDLVIEMPNFVSLQSASFFARKNIEILNKLGVNYIAFGIENTSSKDFRKKIETIIKKNEQIDNLTKYYLKKGYSYTKSSYMSLEEILEDKNFLTSNNILAFEYVRAINEIGSNILFFPIERIGANNRDRQIKDKTFASSTAIRKSILEENIEDLIPYPSFKSINEFYDDYNIFPSYKDLFNLLKYLILIEKKSMEDILCFEEGMDNLFYKNIISTNNFTDFLNSSTSTRFTSSRIKRLVINYLLDNKTFLNEIDINFVKILASNKNGMKILSRSNMKKIISKRDIENLSNNERTILDSMVKSSNLYNMIIGQSIDYDFKRKFTLK